MRKPDDPQPTELRQKEEEPEKISAKTLQNHVQHIDGRTDEVASHIEKRDDRMQAGEKI